MSQEYRFEEKDKFLHKLEELVESGIDTKTVEVFTPYPCHESEEILKDKTSPLRFFTLIGAITGLLFGFFLATWTSLDWPLIRGGKPIVAIPPFIVVAFELTILFGGVISFLGFLILGRFPKFKNIKEPIEYGNEFVIQIQSEAK